MAPDFSNDVTPDVSHVTGAASHRLKPTEAFRFIRKMRGFAQAHLIEAVDGNFYVVKFASQLQCHRILINEWISSVVLNHLGIATPQRAAVYLSDGFLANNTDVYLQLHASRRAVDSGWHFGSRFPNNPTTTAVYDFVPDTLLASIDNVADFLGALAFDKWMGNADSRQAIFFWAKLKQRIPSAEGDGLKRRLTVQMIDNGQSFQGADWNLGVSPIQGMYFRRTVYQGVRSLEDFEPWLTLIATFSDYVLSQAVEELPNSWLVGERAALEVLLTRLQQHRKSVPDLICQCQASHVNPFPNWE
jgi:hypothetical protein